MNSRILATPIRRASNRKFDLVLSPGAFGRAVVGYWGKELAELPFKATAEHFNRDPVVISKGIKGLEKRIQKDEEIAATITMLRESLTKSRDPIPI